MEQKSKYVLSLMWVVLLLPCGSCEWGEQTEHKVVQQHLRYSECQEFQINDTTHTTFALSDIDESAEHQTFSFTILIQPSAMAATWYASFMTLDPWWLSDRPLYNSYKPMLPYTIGVNNDGIFIQRYNAELEKVSHQHVFPSTDDTFDRLTGLRITIEHTTGLLSVQILGERNPVIRIVDPYPINVNYVEFTGTDFFINVFNCPLESLNTVPEFPATEIVSMNQTSEHLDGPLEWYRCLKYTSGPGMGFAEQFPISQIANKDMSESVIDFHIYIDAIDDVTILLSSDALFPTGYPAYFFYISGLSQETISCRLDRDDLIVQDNVEISHNSEKRNIKVSFRQMDDGNFIIEINGKIVIDWTDQFPIDLRYASFTSDGMDQSIWYLDCMEDFNGSISNDNP